MGVDKTRLLGFLTERGKHSEPLIVAVYQGLADRVRRGDFDERKDDPDE